MAGPSNVELLTAEAISYPNALLGHDITAELMEVGHIVDIELRPNEDVVFHEDIYASTAVDLEVVGTSINLAEVLRAENGIRSGPARVEFQICTTDSA